MHSYRRKVQISPVCKVPTLLRHTKAVHRQTDPSVCVNVRFQCICCPYLPVPFDLYFYPAYRNAQGSVEEDPVALLQASHTAAKPSKVWCALLLAHMQLVPSSPCSHRVLCCAVNSLPRLVTLQCSTVTSPIEEWMMSSFWLLPLHLFVWFCYSPRPTSPVYQVCIYSVVVLPGVSASRITTGFLLHNKPKAFFLKCLYLFIYLVFASP